jgi:cytochrome c-type biogenesis protein CcmF
MAAMLVVLLGTLLPLVHKELGLGSISIGEPFFNTMFTALMAPFALLLGLGPLIRWRRDIGKQIKRLIIALLVTLSLLWRCRGCAGPDCRHGGSGSDDGDLGTALCPD